MRRGAPVALLLVAGCSRACAPDRLVGDDAAEPSTSPEAAVLFAPARCAPAADAVTFERLAMGEVPGDVLVVGDRVLLTSVRSGVSSVGVTSAALDHVAWTALAPALGDAPPAVLTSAADHAYALFWQGAAVDGGKKGGDDARTLVVAEIGATVDRRWSATEEHASESLGVDAAFAGPWGLAAWDSSDGIRVAALAPNEPMRPKALSSPGALASSPRVVRRRSDYVIVWTERKLESLADGAPRPQPGETIESPGERRAYEWLAFAIVDDGGALRAGPKRITADTGHVGRFDTLLLPDDSIEVYGNDEAQTSGHDEVGGRLVFTTIRGDQVDAPTAVVPSGVGNGEPSALRVEGVTWLFFEDSLGRARANVLGSSASLPSLEPALLDVRLQTAIGDAWVGASTSALVRVRCGVSGPPDASFQTK